MIYLQALRNAMLSGEAQVELLTIYESINVSIDSDISVELESDFNTQIGCNE